MSHPKRTKVMNPSVLGGRVLSIRPNAVRKKLISGRTLYNVVRDLEYNKN